MFSVRQKREIAEAVQTILRATDHPELPKTGEIRFKLRVDGAEEWSWAEIVNNGAVAVPGVNPHNELQDSANNTGESSPAPDGSALRYRCEGGIGCVKPGCEFIAKGLPCDEHEKLYICPLNHWRSCRWSVMPSAAGQGAAKPHPAPDGSTNLYFRLAMISAVESLEDAVQQLSPDANSVVLLACRGALRDARRFLRV